MIQTGVERIGKNVEKELQTAKDVAEAVNDEHSLYNLAQAIPMTWKYIASQGNPNPEADYRNY